MQHKTMLATWVPIELAERLDSMAHERGVSISAVVREALSLFVYGKVIPLVTEHRGNRDGQDDAARAVVRTHRDMTVPALMKALNDVGIRRGKTWVTDARLEARK